MLTEQEQKRFVQLREDIEQISAAASHDLRDMLREALKDCETLKQGAGQEQNALIQHIESCIAGTMENVAALRQYAYLAQNLERPQNVALEDVMARAKEHFAEHLVARHAKIIWRADLHAPLTARPSQLELLFQHLFDNGLKYNRHAQPEVKVTIEGTAQGYSITVEDNGEGMEPEFAYLVFGLFKRVNPHGIVKGSGAGLAFCKKVAENHGGSISMVCEAGYGCRVTLTLPQMQEQANKASHLAAEKHLH